MLSALASALASALLAGAPCPPPPEAVPYLPDGGVELVMWQGEPYVPGVPFGCGFFASTAERESARDVSADECARRRSWCSAGVAELRDDTSTARKQLWTVIRLTPVEASASFASRLATLGERDFVAARTRQLSPGRAAALEEAFETFDEALAWLVAHGEPAVRDSSRCRRIRNAELYLKEPLDRHAGRRSRKASRSGSPNSLVATRETKRDRTARIPRATTRGSFAGTTRGRGCLRRSFEARHAVDPWHVLVRVRVLD